MQDDAFVEAASLPRRGVRRARVVRGGIALGSAGAVAVLALVAPTLTAPAEASNQRSAVPTATAGTRPGTTDAFAARGESTDRSASRDAAAAQGVSDAAAARASALDAVGEEVSGAQAKAAAQQRAQNLSETRSAISAEQERLDSIVFLWPTAGSISSPWGQRFHPILHYTRLHAGVDIGGALNAPIYAAADGVVTQAALGYNGGSGNNVRIDHGSVKGEKLESGYLHMESIDVQVGQKVKKGQKIGAVGTTGLSTAPHLHFAVYVNGVNSDPEPYLKQG